MPAHRPRAALLFALGLAIANPGLPAQAETPGCDTGPATLLPTMPSICTINTTCEFSQGCDAGGAVYANGTGLVGGLLQGTWQGNPTLAECGPSVIYCEDKPVAPVQIDAGAATFSCRADGIAYWAGAYCTVKLTAR